MRVMGTWLGAAWSAMRAMRAGMAMHPREEKSVESTSTLGVAAKATPSKPTP
jgi:hypothetical protein